LLRASGLEFADPPQQTSIMEGRGFIPSINGLGHGPIPLAQTHPRKPLPPSARRWRFLIANARLEFRLSDRKRGLLKIPNRERIAIFYVGFFGYVAWEKGKRAGRDAGGTKNAVVAAVKNGRRCCGLWLAQALRLSG
jgi:hypothetical protein